MSGIKVRPLRDHLSFGAIVEGVTWENVSQGSVRAELNATFEQCGLIVFEGMEETDRMHIALSKVFGPLKDHPTKGVARTAEDEAEGVIDMHYVPGPDPYSVTGLVEIDGKLLAKFSPWHFDHCYNDELNRAGVLRAAIRPPEGGRTGFLDGIALYEALAQPLRESIEGANIVYTLDTRLTKMRFGVNFRPLGDAQGSIDLLKEVAIFPRAMHPAVWQRTSGEKVLHVSGWMADGIEHRENAEGDAILAEICDDINAIGESDAAYWHDWKAGDMIIWDNWRMLHAVEGCDAKFERHTKRTTIKGDYGLGYFEDGKKIGEVVREIAA